MSTVLPVRRSLVSESQLPDQGILSMHGEWQNALCMTILAEGAIALSVTLSGGALFAS